MRAAVVEIGSRAVRLLVADLSATEPLRVVRTGTKLVDLGGALKKSRAEADAALSLLQETINQHLRVAQAERAEKISVFGTEALRRVAEAMPEQLARLTPQIDVLSKEREAKATFCAALTDPAIKAKPGLQHVAIDVGNGSIEITAGSVKGGLPNLRQAISLPLGISTLIDRLHAVGESLQELRSWIRFSLSDQLIPQPGIAASSILLGSAPTKAAWLKVRPGEQSIYSPQLVGGISLSRREIDCCINDIYALWCRSRERARSFVDFRINDDSEVLMLLAGLTLVDEVFKSQGRLDYNCKVSAHGVRFGYILEIATPES